MTGGDFSQEAYEALREAYANQLTSQEEVEMAGVQVMGQNLPSETLPVNSPWRDKIQTWEYPTGKSAYKDGPQKTPEEVLQIMREAAAERDEAEAADKTDEEVIAEMSDEEFDSYIDNILESLDEEEESEEDDESEDIEMSDEETDELIDAIVNEEEEDEDEEEEVQEEVQEKEEDTEEYDPEDIAAEIAAIREELESMQFTPEEE